MELSATLTGIPVGALGPPDFWQAVIIVALALVGLRLWSLPGELKGHLNATLKLQGVVQQLQNIGTSAANALTQVNALDETLTAQKRSNNLTSVIQTLYGVIIGLWGGFLAGWVANGGPVLPEGLLPRGLLITLGGALLVATLPFTVFKAVDWYLAHHGPGPEQ